MIAFTKEWIDCVAGVLKNDELYQQKATGFDSSFQFVIKAAPEKGVPEGHSCGLNLPECDETWEEERPGTDYVMTGPYETFHSILTGKTGAVMAITTRKVKIKGNLAKLLKFTGAINRFVEILGEVGSEFEGDFR
ncbi:SCP2 sterol-binding domain-containing protein [Thermodesulfobacteriota bacterium]